MRFSVQSICVGFLSACLYPALAGLPLCAVVPTTHLAQYAHHVWRFGDAGLLGTPQGVAQTADGYIWVSTPVGLFQFDGIRFTQWHPPAGESLPSDSIWNIFGSRDGSLYVGTGQGLARITGGHVFRYPGSPRWPGPFVEDVAGNVWTGVQGVQSAPKTICRIGASSLACLGGHVGPVCPRGMSNTIDTEGHLWIGSTGSICELMPNDELHSYPIPPEETIRSMAMGSDGSLWAGSENRPSGGGLRRWKAGHWEVFPVPPIDGKPFSVSALLASGDGSLWIGSADQGLLKLYRGHLDRFDSTDGLTAAHVLSIFEDREGGVWVVTPAGIDFFRDYAVLSIAPQLAMAGDRARTITSDTHGMVLFGSTTLATLNQQSFTRFLDQHGRPLHNIEFLFTDSRDDIWIGASGRLFRLQGEHILNPVVDFPVAAGRHIAYITEDENHDLWVVADSGTTRTSVLVHLHQSRVAELYQQGPALQGQTINAIAADSAGGLWIGGSARGLFHFGHGTFQAVLPHDMKDRVENFSRDPDGALWIVTPHGFSRYSNGVLKKLPLDDAAPCDSGVNMQNDHRGSYWLYLHCGILRIPDEQVHMWWRGDAVSVHGTLFGAQQGARPNLSDSSPAETPDGRLWSASDYMYQVIDPHHLPENSLPPPVVIQRFSADGVSYQPKDTVTLQQHTHGVEIDYAGLSYLVPDLVRFRYRLSDHDAEWVEAGTRRDVLYTNLTPGKYVFRVIACNNDGVWNREGATIHFVIPPTWYQTVAFRVAAVILLIILLFLIYAYRLRRLSTNLKLRFDERLEERTRLSRDLHDTLLQTVQGSKMVADEAKEHLDDPASTEHSLERLSEWLGRALMEGRAALDALRASPLEADDLVGAMRQIAADCTLRTAMAAHVSAVGPIRKLHPVAREEVYLIGYEAVRNACAHSAAREMWISIDFRRVFRLEIRDNGRGIDEQILRVGKSGHFGLAGMRERTAALGGTLTVANQPTGGVVVSLRVPGTVIYRSKHRSDGIRARLQRYIVPGRNSGTS